MTWNNTWQPVRYITEEASNSNMVDYLCFVCFYFLATIWNKIYMADKKNILTLYGNEYMDILIVRQ